MKRTRIYKQIILFSSSATLLGVGSCLANIENGLNMALSPTVIENALRLPYSNLMSAFEPLIRLL